VYTAVYRPCTRPVYTTVYRPCAHRLYKAVYAPCTRPCTRTCTQPLRPVYTAHVNGCVLAVYKAVYMAGTRPCNGGVHVCICRTAVYTAVNGPRSQPRTGHVGPCTRPYTRRAVYAVICTARVHEHVERVYFLCIWHVRVVYRDTCRVHGSCTVYYYDFLCKRHHLCRNVQL